MAAMGRVQLYAIKWGDVPLLPLKQLLKGLGIR